MPKLMPNTLTMAQASNKSAPTLFLQTSMDLTLSLFSPCSTPDCGLCPSKPSLTDSSSTSSRSTTSSTSSSPSAQAVLAAMDNVPEPPADHESSDLVHEMMAAARARAGFVPGASAFRAESLPPLPLTAEQQDFDDRVEAAISKSSALIAEAQAQLAAPKIAPAELTEEEKVEIRRNRAWDLQYKLKNEAIDKFMESNQALFRDVTGMIDELACKGIPIPDCNDLLTWESNAGSAGTPSKTAAKWPGMYVGNLVTKYNG